jgi:type IV pilus assembly protein PilM
LSSISTLRQPDTRASGLFSRLSRWLDAMPHPNVAIEFAPDRIAAARWKGSSVDEFTIETLPPAALVPSAVEANVINAAALKTAMANIVSRLRAKDHDVALILPDPIIRVFVQHFEEFPRSAQEAIPMLRWKLKKSIPFEADETVISYMRQPARGDGVDIVTALSRLRILREYESLAESASLNPGVVLSSSLAAVSLLDENKATLLARVSGVALTTAIVRGGMLCGYRCTELPAHSGDITPKMLLDEIYPVAAYYQDTWGEGIGSVRLAGLGGRLPDFVPPLESEFHCNVTSLLHGAVSDGRIPHHARQLADREADGLVGWMMHRN